MEKLEKELSEWHREKFGTECVDLQRTILKLTEEVGEVARAILRNEKEHAAEELADCFFVLVHLARALNTTLETEVKNKLKVIWKRIRK